MNTGSELKIFEAEDGNIKLDVKIEDETVWLTQMQMSELFERDRTVITRHIKNIFTENEVDEESNVHFLHFAGSDKPVAVYSLDVIISVGYRVKSKRGTEFRKWANNVLKQYILTGYALNETRLNQIGEIVKIMKRADNLLEGREVLNVIEKYASALNLLDDYDHQTISKPKGKKAVYVINYDECKEIISKMQFISESKLFGNEKDDSFKASISAIYQTFEGDEVYPSLEEKAANLLYFITKNHSFSDGNKRIAAAIFLYFLDRNGVIIKNGKKIIDDHTLVAITIMVAESKPDEKETMIKLIMNFLD